MVVEAGAPQQLVVHRKAERLHQVQLAAAVGGQADHVAGVGRDLRFDEDDAEHRGLTSSPNGVRATTHTSTRAAPARVSASAAACAVAPVVNTSSTSATCTALQPMALPRLDPERVAQVVLALGACHADLVRRVAAALQHVGARRHVRAGAPVGARAPTPGCSRARAAARATTAPAAAARARASRAVARTARSTSSHSAAASSAFLVELEAGDQLVPRVRVVGAGEARIERAGRAHAFAAARQGRGQHPRAACTTRAQRREALQAGFTHAHGGTSRGTRRTGRAAQRGVPRRAACATDRAIGSIYCSLMPPPAPRVTPLEDFHEPAAARVRSRMARRERAVAARRGRPTHGRAAADHPTSAAALARLVGPCRWQRRRGAHGLSAGTTHRGRARRGVARAQRRAPAAVVVAPALGPAGRGGGAASRGRSGRQPRWCGPT